MVFGTTGVIVIIGIVIRDCIGDIIVRILEGYQYGGGL